MTAGSLGDRAALPMRLSVPARGHVLSTAAETYGKPIREAVQIIADGLGGEPIPKPNWLLEAPHLADYQIVVRPEREMAARHICTQWVVGVALRTLAPSDSLERAASWFGSDSDQSLVPVLARIPSRCKAQALVHLSSAADPDAWAELLPYLLDPHGPGSRLSVMRDPNTRATRERKRSNGSFYTPADVAEYMVETALDDRVSDPIKVLDPACGTGVYLRAALSSLRRAHPETDPVAVAENLYGIDIDPWAVHASAYVLVHDIITGGPGNAEPARLWERLRRNLHVGDALRLDPPGCDLPDANPITQVFPGIESGPDLIVGNPPYTQLGNRPDLLKLAIRFQTLRPVSAKAEINPLFVEQTVRLARQEVAAALVLPLSIGFNTRPQFMAARGLIERTPGTWRFSFFDREPHALFGEDVKTRNTVIVWKRNRNTDRCTVMTSPLLKWRGQSRARMFKSIRHTSISNSIVPGVPKIGSAIEAESLGALFQHDGLGESVLAIRSCGLQETFTGDEATVFVASTAYNFLNVFFRPSGYLKGVGKLSENSVHAIDLKSRQDALVAYALLSSRTAFWLWHVLGDGFHVTQTTLENLPLRLSLFDPEALNQLASIGSAIWEKAKSQPLTSYNRGRISLAFPNPDPSLQRDVDVLIAAAAKLPIGFPEILDTIIHSVITAEPLGRLQANENISCMKISPSYAKERSKLTKEEWREYTKTVWQIANTTHAEHPAVFPVEIPNRLIKLFSLYGEAVLDPFAGAGNTAKAAIPLGRKAICIDQNPKYMDIIRRDCTGLRNGHRDDFQALEVVHGDSRDMSFVASNSIGLVVTSPPYWNKADYGPGWNNLGKLDSYPDFIEATRPVWQECYRTLMPGRKLCIVTANVNQHTDRGLLTFPLAADFAVLLRNMGFVMINEIIWSKDGTGGKWGSYGVQRPIFGSYPYPPNLLFKNVHEYILIFAKPATNKTKGPKVRPYGEIMTSAETDYDTHMRISIPEH